MEPREGGTDQEDRGVGNQRFDFGGAEQSRNICPEQSVLAKKDRFSENKDSPVLRGVFFRPTDFFR